MSSAGRAALWLSVCALVVAFAATRAPGLAQDATDASEKEIERYRQMLKADPWSNPAMLDVDRGEGLWKTPRGPKATSLEACDLGKGPGVVKGAFAELPRYFADADRVMDLESRLVWCRMALQGMSVADAKRGPFGSPERKSDIEALVAYVTNASRGVKMAVSLDHPKMREAYAIGEKIFFFRGGPHDFACATCHGEDGKRIRLQDLPNLTSKAGAQKGYTTWPAYRVSQGELRTFQWRLNDCFRQQRFPELDFTSPASVALTTFLAYNANGAAFDAPSIKR